jgi:hypothetical protein
MHVDAVQLFCYHRVKAEFTCYSPSSPVALHFCQCNLQAFIVERDLCNSR